MFATENDYEEAIRGASIHAYDRKEKKKRVLGKLFSLTTVAVLFSVGFSYYQEHSLQKFKEEVQNLMVSSEPLAKNVPDNSKLTQQVLEISQEESSEQKSFQSSSEEDEYLSKLKHSADVPVQNLAQKDEYLIALDNMEVDVLDDFQPRSMPIALTSKATQATDLNQMNLSEAMSDLVDEAIADNSNYTNDLKKEIITESKSKGRIVVVKKGDTLESISKKFYGNPMKYKAIMASNSNLLDNSNVIYEGQEITLP